MDKQYLDVVQSTVWGSTVLRVKEIVISMQIRSERISVLKRVQRE